MPGTLTAGRSADREPRGEDDPDVHTQLFIQAGADDLPAGQDRRRRVSRARPARPVPRTRPLNRETPLPALTGGVVTPTARFYVRNHSPAPRLDPASWQLEVSGLVDRPLWVSLRELHHMPAETLAATLECPGNGRAGFDPPAEGTVAARRGQHRGVDRGAAGRGPRPRRPSARALEIVFRGAGQGAAGDAAALIRFERSLPRKGQQPKARSALGGSCSP